MSAVTIVKDSNNRLLHYTNASLMPAETPKGEWRDYSRVTTACGEQIHAPTAGLTWRGYARDITCQACLNLSSAPHSGQPNTALQLCGRNSRSSKTNRKNVTFTGLLPDTTSRNHD